MGTDGGLDHVNTIYYRADLTVKNINVNLQTCWRTGRLEAQALLAQAESDFDILSSLQAVPGADLMRPNGRTYPGVSSTEPDRSQDSADTTENAEGSYSLGAGPLQPLDAVFATLPIATTPSNNTSMSASSVDLPLSPAYGELHECMDIPYDTILVPNNFESGTRTLDGHK